MKTMKKNIGIGIIDSQYNKKSDLRGLKNRISYWNDGICRNGISRKKNQGIGFTQGETVKVMLDFAMCTVTWLVDGQIRHTIDCSLLTDLSIQWVPFVCLESVGDCVALTS